MPFQALPIALDANPGDPIAKLAWIFIVERVAVDAGGALIVLNIIEISRFCQVDIAEARRALGVLRRCGLITIADDDPYDFMTEVALPLSFSELADRKRLKPSPDQLEMLIERAGRVCRSCSRGEDEIEGWHVDHIIPRSLGGADVEANCQALCNECNTRKGARLGWVDFLGNRK